MNRAKSLFRTFSLLIEEYAVELFIFEALVIILVFHSRGTLEHLAVAIPVTIIISEGIKLTVKENRPKVAMERAYFKKNASRLKTRSFPSTHSSIVMAFTAVMYKTPAFAPLLVFAFVVMYSRLYLKAHFIRDIVAGAAIGAIVGYLTTIFI